MYLTFNFDSLSLEHLKKSLIRFADNFDLALILDSNSQYLSSGNYCYKNYDLIAGFCNTSETSGLITSFSQLHKIDQSLKHWYLGYLTYDVKNEFENLHSNNPDFLNWPPLLFFRPYILLLVRDNQLEISSEDQNMTPQDILNYLFASKIAFQPIELLNLRPRITKEKYLILTNDIMAHIRRGDIYELNFCHEFYNNQKIDPYSTYFAINSHTPSPFSAFIKYHDLYLISASPERFLKKEGQKIISQPMKGTTSRSSDAFEDSRLRNILRTSRKEQAENIMITDLVRNDLSRIACSNSVEVDELCGIYTFPHVYQMISTISATLKAVTFVEILKATFPMGSMTGAPKIRAMELIETYETVKRGLYSGTVGYISPGMDFDFNVVIRSLQYNAQTNYLSYMTGSAITALSDLEKEYEECILKSYAINPVQEPV